jgi:putative transposon-encoded protein
MAASKKENGLKEIVPGMDGHGRPPRSKFEVFGEEMIEKEVKHSGHNGRVYLPPVWVGKRVKIIRID